MSFQQYLAGHYCHAINAVVWVAYKVVIDGAAHHRDTNVVTFIRQKER
jgi:hypothetical protein